MSIELVVLLLVCASALAWWAGRNSARRSAQTETNSVPAHYFQGLNYLLNEQPDKAIEVFIKLIEVDSETVETHFALGNLFRRRGEVDRAIRVHQNLIARPTLSKAQRTQALYELGLDYMRSGILSRAEAVFEQLIDDDVQGTAALKQLVEIYQQEREWAKAIAVTEKLAVATGNKMGATIAQYYCELAELARNQNDQEQARKHIATALRHDARCVRASLLEADIAARSRDPRGAIKALQRVEEQDSDFLPEIFAPIVDGYIALGEADNAAEYLRNLFDKFGGISALLAVAELIRKKSGDAASAAFIAEQLRKRPSVRGLHRLIELSLARSSGDARDNLMVLQELTSSLLQNKPVYKCRQCGFNAKALHWQCPGCKTWNSLKPVHGVEGE